MSLYDTRFFFEHYFSTDRGTLTWTKGELANRGPKSVSSVTVHEVYKLVLEKEGRDVARLRTDVMVKEFGVIPMDSRVAILSAELRSKHRIPMADSVILATAKLHSLDCVTDDPHFAKDKEVKTRWIG